MSKKKALTKLEIERKKMVYGTQAERVIAKFGGPSALLKALTEIGEKISPSAIHRWKRPKEIGGADGLVPNQSMPKIIRAALNAGIHLTSRDLDPRETIDPGKLMVPDETIEKETVKEKEFLEKERNTKTKAPRTLDIDLTKIYKP